MADPTLVESGDFEAVEAAVMETARGRWFLAEYLRRHRAADTAAVLEAIGRLGSAADRPVPASPSPMTLAAEMRSALDEARDALAKLRPVGAEATEAVATGWPELIGGKVDLGEALMEAAGEIQELGRRYRATPGSGRTGERLTERAVEIYAACGHDEELRRRLDVVVALVRQVEAIVAMTPCDEVAVEAVAAVVEPAPVAVSPVPRWAAKPDPEPRLATRPSTPQKLDSGVIAFLEASLSAIRKPPVAGDDGPAGATARAMTDGAAALSVAAPDVAWRAEVADPSAGLSKLELRALFS